MPASGTGQWVGCHLNAQDVCCDNRAGGIKDLGLMQRLAKESNVPLPLADIIKGHEEEAQQQGKGDLDWGCIVDLLRSKAGLPER